MIRYALACAAGHEFESWFPNAAAYEKQAKRGLIACPACGSDKVEKAIMAPRLKRTDKSAGPPIAAPEPAEPTEAAETPKAPVALMSAHEREFRAKLKELREHVTRHAENVGRRFPEEARKMHYGESERRSIYGEASLQDAKVLHEEGIEFHPLPLLPDDRN